MGPMGLKTAAIALAILCLLPPAASQDMTDYAERQAALRDPAQRRQMVRDIQADFAMAETERAAGNCQQRRIGQLATLQATFDGIERLQSGDVPTFAPVPTARRRR